MIHQYKTLQRQKQNSHTAGAKIEKRNDNQDSRNMVQFSYSMYVSRSLIMKIMTAT